MWRVQRVVLWQQLNKWSRLVAGTRMQIKGTVSKDQLKQRTGQRAYPGRDCGKGWSLFCTKK